MNKTVKLRPHHCVCLEYFRGRGYSLDFADRMTVLKRRLDGHPETEVEIVSGPDDICRSCPNLADECAVFEKVSTLDREWGAAAGLAEAERAPWSEIRAGVEKALADEKTFRSICGRCEWLSLCSSVRGENAGK